MALVIRMAAARALRDNAVERKDGPAFLEITDALSKYPEATFRDRIVYVQALHTLDHPDFAKRLADLQVPAVPETAARRILTLPPRYEMDRVQTQEADARP